MSPPESVLVRNTIKKLKSRFGGWWINVHGNVFQCAGIPDIIGITRGKFFAFEAKLPGKEKSLKNVQAFHLYQINKAGGTAEMITSTRHAVVLVSLELK